MATLTPPPSEPTRLLLLGVDEAVAALLAREGLAAQDCADTNRAAWLAHAAQEHGEPLQLAVLAGPQARTAAQVLRAMEPELEMLVLTAGAAQVPDEAEQDPRMLLLSSALSAEDVAALVRGLWARRQASAQRQSQAGAVEAEVEARTRLLTEANRRLKRDLVIRMRMLQDLLESEERYRLLFEEDITGDFVANPDGSLKACNKAFASIFGYADVDAAMSANIFDLRLETADADPLPEILGRRRKLENFEAVLRRGGLAVHVIGTLLGIFNVRGEMVEVRGYFLDITERKRLEEQLRSAQKMEAIGTLAGGIAHDFNNILGVITGYAEILLDGADKGTSAHRRLQEILSACRRAKDLINQILNFSRQGSLEKKALRVGPLVRETCRMLETSLPKDAAGIELRLNLQAENDTVVADPSQIHQILLNLGTNAVHAMRQQGGLLEVSLTEALVDPLQAGGSGMGGLAGLTRGRYLVITVADSGPGIPRAILDKIFDPFFTTKKPGEGTGMGLAVVHGIVRKHGGAVTVQSEPGQGTAFQVYLPLSMLLDDDEAEAPRGAGRVLFVDDEKALVDMGREMLEGLGYEVVARTSSVEALEAFRFQPDRFDVVLLDQNMPNLTGLELAQRMLAARPGVPVLLCTGFSEIVSPSKARELGVREILMKPMLRRQLAEALLRAMRGP